MKILIDTSGFNKWGGGRDFLNHIIECLEVAGLAELRIVLYDYSRAGIVAGVKSRIKKFFNKMCNTKFTLNPTVDEQIEWFNLDKGRVYDVISPNKRDLYFESIGDEYTIMPCFYPLECTTAKWIGYIYDYQHKYLLNYFSKKEIATRDRAFREMLSKAKSILVNSKKTRDDILKFNPGYKGRILVLPYSPHPNKIWLSNDSEKGFDDKKFGRYFIVSNQLWLHKNHVTVIKALHHLKSNYNLYDVKVLCTGGLIDHRNPKHFKELLALVEELGLNDNIEFLGHIPKLDQVGLLKNSIALIQPTLYEGGPGGGSVYDAVSLGVPVIVSDIEVNREIEADNTILFFEATNSKDLAEKMLTFWRDKPLRPSNEVLFERGLQRKIACGKYIIDNI